MERTPEYRLRIEVNGHGGKVEMCAEKVVQLPFAPLPCDQILRLWGGPCEDMGVEVAAYDLNKKEFYGIALDVSAEYDTPEQFRKAYSGWKVHEAKPRRDRK